MSGLEKINQKKDLISEIASRYGASNLRAFGSVVRHEDRPDSDIDILVHMSPGHDLLDMLAMSRELEELLQQKIDVVTDEELSPYLKKLILDEAVAI